MLTRNEICRIELSIQLTWMRWRTVHRWLRPHQGCSTSHGSTSRDETRCHDPPPKRNLALSLSLALARLLTTPAGFQCSEVNKDWTLKAKAKVCPSRPRPRPRTQSSRPRTRPTNFVFARTGSRILTITKLEFAQMLRLTTTKHFKSISLREMNLTNFPRTWFWP